MDLKKQIENHIITVIVGVAIATASTVWIASEQIRVKPLERQIIEYDKKIEPLNNTIKELRNNSDPYRKKVEVLENDLSVAQGNLKQWQDAVTAWQKRNSELKQSLNLYASNCSIISEIHALDSRKIELEKDINIYTNAGHSNADNVTEWRRQADQYQVRILDLQKRLLCQQP